MPDMSQYQAYMDQSLDAARKGDWKTAISLAKRVPYSWDVWQQFPSVAMGRDDNGPGMPDEAIHATLDALRGRHDASSFLFELANNLPKTIGSDTLVRVAREGSGDYYVQKAVQQHPNFKLDPHSQALKDASDFWAGYEESVQPHHFATVKSLYTGQPEELVDHRGELGSSHDHMSLLPSLQAYSQAVQREVYRNAEGRDYKIKYYGSEPYIKVWRGVGGRYAAAIAKAANYDPATGEVDSKDLKVPTAHLTSWSTNPELAHRFATTRAKSLHPDTNSEDTKGVGVVFERWLPLKNLLHSGMHTVAIGQDHPHPDEEELVFGHPEEHVKVPTSQLYFLHQPEDKHQYPWPSKRARPRMKLGKSEGQLVPAKDLLISDNSLREAYFNVSGGKGSKTAGPLDVWELEDGRKLLVDGHHRMVRHLLSGAKTVPIRVVGRGYTDYWATPSRPFEHSDSQYGGLEDFVGDPEMLDDLAQSSAAELERSESDSLVEVGSYILSSYVRE